MTLRFHMDDAAFVSWLESREDGGYVATVSGSRVLLHQASCRHFKPRDRWAKTDSPKYCDDSAKTLLLHPDFRSREVRDCKSCHPSG